MKTMNRIDLRINKYENVSNSVAQCQQNVKNKQQQMQNSDQLLNIFKFLYF